MRISGEVTLPDGSEQSRKGQISSLTHVFTYLAPYRLAIAGAVVALIFTSSAILGMGYGLRFLVDEGIGKGDEALLNQAFTFLFAGVLVLAAMTFARYYFVSYVGERVVADIRNDVYRHVVAMHTAFFETTRTGELLSRLTTDTTLLQTVVGSSVSVALRNSLLLVGGVTMLMITSLRLTEYVLIMIPIVVIPIITLGRRVRKLSRQTQDRVADISTHAEETITSIRTIQALSLETHESERFQGHVGVALSTALSRIRMRAILTAIVITLVLGAVTTVLWIGGRDVIAGHISPGELSSFVFYAMLVAGSTGAISEVVGDLQRAAGATERLMELKAMTPEIREPENATPLPKKLKGKLTFDNISFHYPSRPDDRALRDVSFTVEPGEVVALVGPSGSGKSTVMQLLLRFYDPQSGRILIDDHDVRSLSPADFRAHIGLVPQDPVIFSTSAFENIRYGKLDATHDDVMQAAKAAEALEFIETLPEGFDTFLGEKGVRLSGGQKQRIAIARAIVRNPDILLLDEATSALDSENERRVQEALETLMKGRTTLVIAHRLATVQNADRILVLEHGRIQASGTHDELMKNSELYNTLATLQFHQLSSAA